MLKQHNGVFMFLSLSKTIVRYGKLRLGLGIRITKKNVIYMGFILMFVYMLHACWYLMILLGWLVYAVCYGIWWCIKKIIEQGKKYIKERKEEGLE